MAAKKKSTQASGRKKTSAKKTSNKKNATQKAEFISLGIIVFGLLLAVFLYIPSGKFGEYINDVLFGLFGVPAVFLAPFVLVLGIHKAINKKFYENINKYVFSGIGILILGGIFHLLSLDKLNPFTISSVSSYFGLGASGVGGGVFGGIITDVLRLAVGSVATGIILFTVFLVIIMVLTKWSPIKALLRVIVKAYLNAKAANKEIYTQVEKDIKQAGENKTGKQTQFKFFDEKDVQRKEEKKASDGEFIPVEAKPYDDESYIPPSLRNIATIENEISDIDKIIENVLPKTDIELDM